MPKPAPVRHDEIAERTEAIQLPDAQRTREEWLLGHRKGAGGHSVQRVENGAGLAWLVDPERRVVEIYRPGREPEVLIDAESVAGEGPVEGFVLDLRRVWDPAGLDPLA